MFQFSEPPGRPCPTCGAPLGVAIHVCRIARIVIDDNVELRIPAGATMLQINRAAGVLVRWSSTQMGAMYPPEDG